MRLGIERARALGFHLICTVKRDTPRSYALKSALLTAEDRTLQATRPQARENGQWTVDNGQWTFPDDRALSQHKHKILFRGVRIFPRHDKSQTRI